MRKREREQSWAAKKATIRLLRREQAKKQRAKTCCSMGEMWELEKIVNRLWWAAEGESGKSQWCGL